LDAHKAPGPDGHHPFVLKNLAQILAKPLTYIFNLSLSTGVVPSEWKLAWIKPFYKGGGQTFNEELLSHQSDVSNRKNARKNSEKSIDVSS
jgi:hypothetical protein